MGFEGLRKREELGHGLAAWLMRLPRYLISGLHAWLHTWTRAFDNRTTLLKFQTTVGWQYSHDKADKKTIGGPAVYADEPQGQDGTSSKDARSLPCLPSLRD